MIRLCQETRVDVAGGKEQDLESGKIVNGGWERFLSSDGQVFIVTP